MELATQTHYAISPGAAEALYVATDLGFWKTDSPATFCRDVQINDTAYRRLDPVYFAWLRSRLALAKEAAKSGRIDPAEFDELRNRFAGIEAWSLDHFGAQTIMAAIRNLTPKAYDPPRGETESRRSEPASRDDERIHRAIRLVDAIREKAVELGWNLERLYRHEGFQKRPFAADYGLVCYIGSKDRIGDVTRQAIEIVGPPPRETRLRFYNPDVDQPWIRRIR
ncbi:MAG TPA: hypothetical protein VMR62_13770 [Bryobacteraceae bacterium]|jgi:hypothetical protein|nr:hypothetical protein [Bryobacteraceae bacterium]